jgi:hypothetical protein
MQFGCKPFSGQDYCSLGVLASEMALISEWTEQCGQKVKKVLDKRRHCKRRDVSTTKVLVDSLRERVDNLFVGRQQIRRQAKVLVFCSRRCPCGLVLGWEFQLGLRFFFPSDFSALDTGRMTPAPRGIG